MTFCYGIDAIDAAAKINGRYKHLLLTPKGPFAAVVVAAFTLAGRVPTPAGGVA